MVKLISLSNEMHVWNIRVSMGSLYSMSSVLSGHPSLYSRNWLLETPLKTEDLGPQPYGPTGEDRVT